MKIGDSPKRPIAQVPPLDFEAWANDVRDPANARSEGKRVLESRNKAAKATYEIAPLPNGNWTIQVTCEYQCGNFTGRSIPWTKFDSREACIDFFITTAHVHFEADEHDSSEQQKKARIDLLVQLKPGLFGFVEPSFSSSDKHTTIG